MSRSTISFALLAGTMLLGSMPGSARADAANNILFIFDASGSMNRKLATGETRIQAARKAISDALAQVPEGVNVGLMAYGHRRAKDCADIELVSPIGVEPADALGHLVETFQARGETPIADTIVRAAKIFRPLKGQSNRIVLVTDGIEECRGDPCAAARQAAEDGIDVKIDVVGFTLDDKQAQKVQCIAHLTGGRYYDARDVSGLSRALTAVKEQVAAAVPAAPPPVSSSLIAAKNGGEILVAPGDGWQRLTDGDEKEPQRGWYQSQPEIVYGFKDGRSAVIERFESLYPSTWEAQLAEVEISVADDSPTGTFMPIGVCRFQNLRLVKSPYQSCALPKTLARYVKIKMQKTFGGLEPNAFEWSLHGRLENDPQPWRPAALPAGAVDLVAAAQGGELLVAPHASWSKATDGDVKDYVRGSYQEKPELVYGFRGGQPATVLRLDNHVPFLQDSQVAEVEVLVGNDTPTGAFTAIGTCRFHNARLTRTLFQPCDLPPTPAKFVKLRLAKTFGGLEPRLYEWRLMGMLGATATTDGIAPPRAAAPRPEAPATVAPQARTPSAPAAPTTVAVPPPAAGSSDSAEPIDLLSGRNGGELLAAPDAAWTRVVDGDEATWHRGGYQSQPELVFGFKEGRSARISSFEALYPLTSDAQAAEIEIAASRNGVAGPFEPVGVCRFQNLRLLKTPFQACRLPETEADAVRVKILKTFGGLEPHAYEWRLFGDLL